MEYYIGMQLKRTKAQTSSFSEAIGEVRTIVEFSSGGSIILDTGFRREVKYYDKYFEPAKQVVIGGE